MVDTSKERDFSTMECFLLVEIMYSSERLDAILIWTLKILILGIIHMQNLKVPSRILSPTIFPTCLVSPIPVDKEDTLAFFSASLPIC